MWAVYREELGSDFRLWIRFSDFLLRPSKTNLMFRVKDPETFSLSWHALIKDEISSWNIPSKRIKRLRKSLAQSKEVATYVKKMTPIKLVKYLYLHSQNNPGHEFSCPGGKGPVTLTKVQQLNMVNCKTNQTSGEYQFLGFLYQKYSDISRSDSENSL